MVPPKLRRYIKCVVLCFDALEERVYQDESKGKIVFRGISLTPYNLSACWAIV